MMELDPDGGELPPEAEAVEGEADVPAEACPFCERVDELSDLPRTSHAAVIGNAFPRAKGHLLVVPLAHTPNYFDLPADVKAELWTLVDSARSYLHGLYQPDGWTVRINIAKIAGQTVDHAHIHVLPHYVRDDVENVH